jgi:uncharacterized Zn-finger protein
MEQLEQPKNLNLGGGNREIINPNWEAGLRRMYEAAAKYPHVFVDIAGEGRTLCNNCNRPRTDHRYQTEGELNRAISQAMEAIAMSILPETGEVSTCDAGDACDAKCPEEFWCGRMHYCILDPGHEGPHDFFGHWTAEDYARLIAIAEARKRCKTSQDLN